MVINEMIQNYSRNVLEYQGAVYSQLGSFPDLEKDEAEILGLETLFLAHRTFREKYGEGECFNYLYTAVQNSLRHACKVKHRERKMFLSLEQMIESKNERTNSFCAFFSDPYDAYIEYDALDEVNRFLEKCKLGDRILCQFMLKHDGIPLKEAHNLLRHHFPNLLFPTTHWGLRKRIKKMDRFLKIYKTLHHE